MSYRLARVILFTHNFAAMRDFYRDTFGLSVIEDEDGWCDMDAGGCSIGIHAAGPGVELGPHFEGPHKLAFYAPDVAAARNDLIAKSVPMGPLHVFGDLHLCDGDDPDGNRIQLSNRA